MVRNDLVSYIYQYYMQGYPLDQISNYLLKTGYGQLEVQEAINYVAYYYKQQPATKVVHTHNLSLKTSILIIALVILVCSFFVGGYLMLNSRDRVENKLLDVNTEVVTKQLLPGEALTYKIALSNFGSEGRFDINMVSEVLDNNKQAIAQKDETFALETSSQYVRNIEIPLDSPDGRYEIRVAVSYAGQEATSSSFFNVRSEAVEDKTPENKSPVIRPENNTPIVKPAENKTISNIDEHAQSQQTIGEILSKISELETAQAKKYCSEISNELYRDTCYGELAKKTKDPETCEPIVSITKKDACLILFALNDENFEVCEFIQDNKLKISCLSLEKKHDNNASVVSIGW